MSKLQLVFVLMAAAAVIIIGLAVYIFTHLSTISMTQGIILVAVAVIGLLIVMGVLIILTRNILAKK